MLNVKKIGGVAFALEKFWHIFIPASNSLFFFFRYDLKIENIVAEHATDLQEEVLKLYNLGLSFS